MSDAENGLPTLASDTDTSARSAAWVAVPIASSTAEGCTSANSPPDPARGVFETLLARDRNAVRADEHLARLRASVATLYNAELPADLPNSVRAAAAASAARQRIRIVARPYGDTLAVDLIVTPVELRELPVVLRPVTVRGGLGAHKWLDRTLLDSLAARADGATPLLLDSDGSVLEAAWGSLFAIESERLLTPPIDQRILPGVTRAALLAAAADVGLTAAEGDLTLVRLQAADALLVTSALIGVAPAVVHGPAPRATLARAISLAHQLCEALGVGSTSLATDM